MSPPKKPIIIKKESLADIEIPEGYELTQEALTACAAKLRRAFADPNMMAGTLTFIEMEL